MGRVVTPGIPPLGYRMAGSVKVFELIARPAEVFLTDQDSGEHRRAPTIPDGHQRFQPRLSQPKTVFAWAITGTVLARRLKQPTGIACRSSYATNCPSRLLFIGTALSCRSPMTGRPVIIRLRRADPFCLDRLRCTSSTSSSPGRLCITPASTSCDRKRWTSAGRLSFIHDAGNEI